MKLNPRQLALHWRLFSAVVARHNPQSAIRDPKFRDSLRHQLYEDAGVTNPDGSAKSLTAVTNAEFTKIVAVFKAIIEPGNLNAQLHALKDQQRRYLFGIRKLARSMGADRFYVAAIVRTMNQEGKLGSSELEELHPNELKKVMIALRQHERRGAVAEPNPF